MILELHAHSKFSFDSIAEPYDIIRTARERGLNGIAVTDHDTIRGSIETRRINADSGFAVIVGTEIASDVGDILGLFIEREIESRLGLEVIDDIHRQGGIAILPHPFKGHKLTGEIIERVDLIEVFNSRTGKQDNLKARELSQKYNKPGIAGSDAHFLSEIGRCRVITDSDNIKEALLNGKFTIQTEYSPMYFCHASQVIKSLKRRKYHKIPVQAARLARSFIFR
jgi:predicted metal-dependent phosphoesterase TrpH